MEPSRHFPPAGTRIDKKTDFYPLETGSVLTHGRPPEAASCPHSSGTPPAASTPNTSVNEPKQTACAAGSPPEGACSHPRASAENRVWLRERGEGAPQPDSALSAETEPLRGQGAPAGKDERSLGGEEAATLFTKPGRLETSAISLHGPLPGQLRRTASPSLCGSPHAKTC